MKNINNLKTSYINAITNSKKYNDMRKINKSRKESLKAMDYFHELAHNVEGGLDAIVEITEGDDYHAAIVTSIMLFHLDKKKGHDSLMKIVLKDIPEHSSCASEALFMLLGVENGHFSDIQECNFSN